MASANAKDPDYQPKVDLSRLDRVANWRGGMLRVYKDPLNSARLASAESYVPYGLGFAIPAQPSLPLPDGIHLKFELVDGALRCVSVAVGEQPRDPYEEARRAHGIQTIERQVALTGKYLRELAIDRLAVQAAQLLAVRLYRRRTGEVIGVRAGAAATWDELTATTWDQRADVKELARQTSHRLKAEVPRRGRKPLSLDKIAEAGEHARRAQKEGKPEAWLIGREMNVQPSTAKKYLRLAREKGLAPPSTRRTTREAEIQRGRSTKPKGA